MGSSPIKEPTTPQSFVSGARVGGKEELRANLLKPYLLRLRSVKDDGAVRALMTLAGIPLSVIDDETGWISVASARRALGAIEEALGAGALTRRDSWLLTRESRHLRADAAPAAKPIDAYRFIAQNPEQASRIGSLTWSAHAVGAHDLSPARRGRGAAASAFATPAKGSSPLCPGFGA
jgi:hypothetical protein